MEGKHVKDLLNAYLEVYTSQVDEATAVASPAPGGRGRKNSYTKEIRTGASTKTSSKYSNVRDAKERMKTPYSKQINTKVQLKANEEVEELDVFDVVLEFLQAEGIVETLEEAEWLMANELDADDIEAILREGLADRIIDAAKAGAKRHSDAMKSVKSGKKRHDAATKKLGKALKPATDTAVSAAKGAGQAARAVGGAIKRGAELERAGARAVHRFGDKINAARKAFNKEAFNVFVNTMISEGVSFDKYTWDEIEYVFNDIFEAQSARENPEKYEREAGKNRSREEVLKGRVMGQLSRMDPDKRAKMEKMMRAYGL